MTKLEVGYLSVNGHLRDRAKEKAVPADRNGFS